MQSLTYASPHAPRVLSLTRAVFGLAFMQHGAQKLFAVLGREEAVTAFSQLWFAGVLEFFGGLLVAVGFFTRPVAFVLSGLMAWAYFQVHIGQAFFPDYWTDDPLSGDLRADGFIYGRGALDTKTGGILHLAAFLALHRSGVPLRRDVIFMGTADEEAGGMFGAGWLVEHRPDLFENVGYLLNEGGGGAQVGDRFEFGVEVTQKVPYWLRLRTVGEPGHGSRPRASSAVTEMVDALARLRAHAFEARIVPAVDTHFKGAAPAHPEPWRTRFRDMAAAIREPGVLRELQEYESGLHALTRNTCSITRLTGSDKINVVPPEAVAEIDCRLLPDQDPDTFLAELGQVLGPEVEVEVLMGFTPAVSSTDTELYRIVEEETLRAFPGASFNPQVLGGFTDSHFFRDLGIVSYGYEATATPQEDRGGVHGNDERVSEENVRRGVVVTLEIVKRFAAARGVSE